MEELDGLDAAPLLGACASVHTYLGCGHAVPHFLKNEGRLREAHPCFKTNIVICNSILSYDNTVILYTIIVYCNITYYYIILYYDMI